jgi:hypothetical protein
LTQLVPHCVKPLLQTQVLPLQTELLQQRGLVNAQGWPGSPPVQVEAKIVSMPKNESMLPNPVAAKAFNAWRREVGVARALVSSSN